MINERTTEKYSAIYYGIIREGVKKMIRARISQTQKEFKSDIRVLIDPYTALWIEISDNSKIEPFWINDQKNVGKVIKSYPIK